MNDLKDRPTHMAETPLERVLYELQHEAICYSEAFYRYIGNQLVRITGDPNLSGQDCVILHGIRLGDRPKSIPEIRHYCNRSDIANIQYSIKKLIKADLVEKHGAGKGRGTTYQVTDRGRRVTDIYAEQRREFIAALPFDEETMIEDAVRAKRILLMLTGLYDHASRSITGK